MSQRTWCAGVVLTMCLSASPAWADERPLAQLPADVGKMAVEVPKQIVASSRESTPFLGIPVGAMKGTWHMLTGSYEQLRESAAQPQRQGKRPAFSYSF